MAVRRIAAPLVTLRVDRGSLKMALRDMGARLTRSRPINMLHHWRIERRIDGNLMGIIHASEFPREYLLSMYAASWDATEMITVPDVDEPHDPRPDEYPPALLSPMIRQAPEFEPGPYWGNR